MKIFKLMSKLFLVASLFFICGCTGCANDNELTGLEVNTDSAKTTYNVGEEFTHDGIVVTAVYADGTKEVITDFSVNADAFNTNAVGSYDITISFTKDGISKESTYQVSVGAVFENLVVDTTEAKTTYFEGEDFTYDGIVVTAKYSGNIETIITDYEVISSSFNKNVKGEYSITVRAMIDGVRRTVYYVVEVVGKLDNINYLIGLNAHVGTEESDRKVLETVGSTYDYSDLVVEAVYLDGTTKTLTSEDYELDATNVDLNTRGSYEVIISYSETYDVANSTETITMNEENFILVLVENKVTGIEFLSGTNEFSYDEFSSDDWKFTVTYADTTTETVEVTDVVIGTADTTSGSHEVTVTYTQEQIDEVKSISVNCQVGYTIAEATSGTMTYSFDATTIPATGLSDKAPIAVGTTYGNYFVVGGTTDKVTQRITDNATTSIELGKALSGTLEFTVTGTATVIVVASSTGNSSTSAVAIIDSQGNVVSNKENISTVTGASSAKATLTYEGLVAGTYRIVSPLDASNDRGVRIYSVSVTQIIGEVTGATYTTNISDVASGTYTKAIDLVENVMSVLAAEGKSVVVEGNSKEIDGFKFTQRLKLGGTGDVNARSIKIEVSGAAKVTVYAMSSGNDARTFQLYNTSFVAITDQKASLGGTIQKVEYEISAAGTYYLASTSGGINVYYISVEVE